MYLNTQGPVLNLRSALLDDEGDSVRAVSRSLGEVHSEQVQLPLQLLMTTLDGQRL